MVGLAVALWMPFHDWWLSLQDNEDVNLDIAHSLYATAKELDPSRPVNTADGVWCVSPLPSVDRARWPHSCCCKEGRSKRLRLADS